MQAVLDREQALAFEGGAKRVGDGTNGARLYLPQLLRMNSFDSMKTRQQPIDMERTDMHEIICPHCGKAFKIDEAGYADILKQVRDGAFEQQLHERLELAE